MDISPAARVPGRTKRISAPVQFVGLAEQGLNFKPTITCVRARYEHRKDGREGRMRSQGGRKRDDGAWQVDIVLLFSYSHLTWLSTSRDLDLKVTRLLEYGIWNGW